MTSREATDHKILEEHVSRVLTGKTDTKEQLFIVKDILIICKKYGTKYKKYIAYFSQLETELENTLQRS